MGSRKNAWRRPPHISLDEWKEACNLAEISILIESHPCDTAIVPLLRDYLDTFREQSSPLLESEAFQLALAIAATEVPKEMERKRGVRARKQVRRALELARLPVSHGRAWKRDEATGAISHQRVQYPVGQGGFHAGTLRLLSRDPGDWQAAIRSDDLMGGDFVYVYDCGSEPVKLVRDVVKTFVRGRARKRIQMLFLSHLDRDHIAGVPALLAPRSGIEVDTIVLPYLDDVDRLIAFGRSAQTASADATERFFRDIVLDPVVTLQRFGPRQIILVPAVDEEDLPESAPIEPPEGDEGAIRWGAISSFDGGTPDAGIMDSGAILLRHAEFVLSVTGKGAWRLRPYVRGPRRQDREAFINAVEVALDWPRGSFSTKVQNAKTRRVLVTRHRTALARAYKWAFGDKNETSLSLYSGPVSPERCGAVFAGRPMLAKAKIGWLGTGDANLRDDEPIRRFEDFYGADLEQVTTFVLPHHGSIHNSDPNRLVSDAETWVANAQPIHRHWKHPDPELSLAEDRKSWYLNTAPAFAQ